MVSYPPWPAWLMHQALLCSLLLARVFHQLPISPGVGAYEHARAIITIIIAMHNHPPLFIRNTGNAIVAALGVITYTLPPL